MIKTTEAFDTWVRTMHDAIAAAEAEALAHHQAGTCHLSEWACSYCEAEA